MWCDVMWCTCIAAPWGEETSWSKLGFVPTRRRRPVSLDAVTFQPASRFPRKYPEPVRWEQIRCCRSYIISPKRVCLRRASQLKRHSSLCRTLPLLNAHLDQANLTLLRNVRSLVSKTRNRMNRESILVLACRLIILKPMNCLGNMDWSYIDLVSVRWV